MTRWSPAATLALAMAGLLSACASNGPGKSIRNATTQPTTTANGVKIGAPYQIDGIWYYPHEDPDYDKVGIASWYGAPFDGRPTATGEIYDMNALTAAHTTLPLPTNVEVTNLENGRSLVLRVNDRGPFVNGRIIDVSRRAAQLLGFERQGTTQVRVRALPDAGSNTMLASAAAPEVRTKAVVAPMPSGDTQLLASVRAESPAKSAPPVRAQPVVRVAMAPIANPAPRPTRAGITEERLAPLPGRTHDTGMGERRPVRDRMFDPAEEQRTLASLLPGAEAESAYSGNGRIAPQPASARYSAPYAEPEVVPAPSVRSGPIYSTSRHHRPSAGSHSGRPTMRWVAGPEPAVILSDASLSTDANAPAGPTLRPTLASVEPSASPVGEDRGGPASGLYIQAGAFLDSGNARHLRAELAAVGPTDIVTSTIDGRVFHRVRVGPLPNEQDAQRALAKLRQIGHPEAHIVQQ